MIELVHRTVGGRVSGVWEFDPARRVLDVVIRARDGELALTIPVCSPGAAASAGDRFLGYPIAPTSPDGDEWVVADAYRFHALLPRAPLLLRGTPAEIAAELRAL